MFQQICFLSLLVGGSCFGIPRNFGHRVISMNVENQGRRDTIVRIGSGLIGFGVISPAEMVSAKSARSLEFEAKMAEKQSQSEDEPPASTPRTAKQAARLLEEQKSNAERPPQEVRVRKSSDGKSPKKTKKKEVVVASGGDAIANAKAKREAQKAAAMSVDRSKKNMTPIEKFKEK